MSDVDTTQSAVSVDVTHYAYKPSLVGSPSEFILGENEVEWRSAMRSLRIPYRDIKQIRLAFRPVTLQTYRFVAEVRTKTGIKFTIASTSWRSLVEYQRHDADYRAFMIEFHRRLAAIGSQARFVTGAPTLLYWPGLVIFSGLMLATISLAVRSVQVGEWQAAGFIGLMLGFFLWQTFGFFRRNLPGAYTPERIPPLVLP